MHEKALEEAEKNAYVDGPVAPLDASGKAQKGVKQKHWRPVAPRNTTKVRKAIICVMARARRREGKAGRMHVL